MSTSSKRRPALGTDPLDAILARTPAPATSPAKPAANGAPSSGKVKTSIELSRALVERLKNAVVALSGPPHHLTQAAVLDSALDAEVTRLEREHNGGRSFPQRKGALRTGRPIGS